MVKVGTILSGFWSEDGKGDCEMYIVGSIDTDCFSSDTALLISIRPSNYTINERLTITLDKIKHNGFLWFNIDDTDRADYDEW